MATELFAANLAQAAVSSGGTDAPASGTTETWTVTSSAMFGAAATGVSQFHVADPAAPGEMILVSNVSGTTWTVTRGAESTTPVAHAEGFTARQVTTAGFLSSVQPGRLLNNRGAIAASTAYNPGDVVAYRGQRVLITTAVTSSAWPNWYTPPALTGGTWIPLTSKAVFYAADWGVVTDSVTDNAPALNRALQYMYNGDFGGGILLLPAAFDSGCGVASTVIIPPCCILAGGGIQASAIYALPGMNADVIQFQTYNNAYQAAIISAATGVTVNQASLRNAFYSGLMNLTVNANSAGQAASSYNYGVNMTTNPQSTAAPGDPGLDPSNFLLNVEIAHCTGDGFYHFGRGQLRVTNCIFRQNSGCGAIASFDSLYTGCNFGLNGLGGVYLNYGSCNGAANKSYDNGQNAQWVSGSNYAAGTCVMYEGAMYRAINAIAGDTTVPSSDTTNWTIVSANAPQAWGTGFYFDSNADEDSWVSSDAQQNAASDYYLHDCVAVSVQGQSCGPAQGAGSNPAHYSSLVLDGAAGCLADIAFNELNDVAYALRVVNGATRNDVRMAGDTSYAAILSPDSLALAGSGNSVRVNGTMLSDDVAAAFKVTGLTGAVAGCRFVGAIASGTAPVSGTFIAGDVIIVLTGSIIICTAGGSQGTWVQA